MMATAGAAGCLGGLCRTASAGKTPPQPEQTLLGKTGITVSRLAQGTGMRGWNRQSNQTRLGFEKFVALLRHAYERGITLFDLADLYGSHVYFREALRSIPRERVTILTKLWWRYDAPIEPGAARYHRKWARLALQRFRHELATDYIDIVLLHCMTRPDWDGELQPYMEALAEAKDKKLVRAVGVSCHDIGALRTAAASPWVDVVLARINPRGEKMDGTPEQVVPVLRQIKQAGKGLIGMKIYGEGRLVHIKDECIRFAMGLGLLDSMSIGFESPEQIDETLRIMASVRQAGIT